MADSPAINSTQSEQVFPEKKNNENGDIKDHDRKQSINSVSSVARTKLTQLIQLATEVEAEGQTNYKKVVDTVFDSVRLFFSLCMKILVFYFNNRYFVRHFPQNTRLNSGALKHQV